tara:strand:- start:2190 stop:3149 length:960 start_codon:yes stop_codon:yes gene_type:complete
MKILAIQNRMGIGDMVIFLPYIEAISKKFSTRVSLLVKDSSKADQYLKNTNYIEQIISLKRHKNKKGLHDGVGGFFKLANELEAHKFDKVVIFNSSLRYNLICRVAGIKEIFQYPLFKKTGQHVTDTPKKLLFEKFALKVNNDPKIYTDKKHTSEMLERYNINNNKINILLGIGGSGPTKRVPSKIFIKLIKLCKEKYDCQFFLATGNQEEEQVILNDILKFYENDCIPLDKLSIYETLPLIKSCNISICNDSSFSHLSSGLNVPTIVLMCDTPLLYGNYSSIMFPVLPEGYSDVTHGTNGKEKISPITIFEKIKSIIK